MLADGGPARHHVGHHPVPAAARPGPGAVLQLAYVDRAGAGPAVTWTRRPARGRAPATGTTRLAGAGRGVRGRSRTRSVSRPGTGSRPRTSPAARSTIDVSGVFVPDDPDAAAWQVSPRLLRPRAGRRRGSRLHLRRRPRGVRLPGRPALRPARRRPHPARRLRTRARRGWGGGPAPDAGARRSVSPVLAGLADGEIAWDSASAPCCRTGGARSPPRGAGAGARRRSGGRRPARPRPGRPAAGGTPQRGPGDGAPARRVAVGRSPRSSCSSGSRWPSSRRQPGSRWSRCCSAPRVGWGRPGAPRRRGRAAPARSGRGRAGGGRPQVARQPQRPACGRACAAAAPARGRGGRARRGGASFTALLQRGVVDAAGDGGDLTAASAATWWSVAGALVLLRVLPPAPAAGAGARAPSTGAVGFVAAARLAGTSTPTTPS